MTDISAINGYSSSIAHASTPADASKTLSADMNTFLTLLTTQLKYQDPLDPTDTAEFTNQLVQYSNVEQSIQTNEKLDSLISLNNNNLGAQAVSYIGKVAQVLGDVMPLDGGKAQATYTLDKDVSSCTIMVKDASGHIVYTETGNKISGTHNFKWDGKDKDGNQLQDGAYQIIVSTSVPEGETAANVVTTILGKVTGVASDSNGVYVGLGESVTANLSDILTVRDGSYLDKNDSLSTEDDKNSGGNSGENISTASVVGEVVDTLANVAGAAALIL